MARPRLTPHQKDVLRTLERMYRDGRPVAEKDIGSPAALGHLRAKGYARVAVVQTGPRGGQYRFWEPVR